MKLRWRTLTEQQRLARDVDGAPYVIMFDRSCDEDGRAVVLEYKTKDEEWEEVEVSDD